MLYWETWDDAFRSPRSYSPDLNEIKYLWDVLEKQDQSMEATTDRLQDLKDLLLRAWCQIPQHSFIRHALLWVIFATKRRQTQFWASGHNFMAGWCMYTCMYFCMHVRTVCMYCICICVCVHLF